VELSIDLHECGFDESRLYADDLRLLFEELEFRTIVERLQRKAATRPTLPATPQPAIDERMYRCVDSADSLTELLAVLAQAQRFAFDSETTGLDIIADHPVGLSFSVEPRKAYYVPLVDSKLSGISAQFVLDALRQPLADASKLKIGHNMKFDLQMLRNVGIEVVGPLADTMIASHLLDAASKSHGLDACCLRYLAYKKIPTSSLIGPRGEISMLDVELEVLTEYACEDAD